MYVLMLVLEKVGGDLYWCAMLHKPVSSKEVLCLLLVESPGGCNIVICSIFDVVDSFGVIIMCCLGYRLSFLCPLSNV